MEAGHEPPAPPGRALALVEAAVAALITCGAAALFYAMPELIAEGGIPAAQDFLRLSPIFFPRLTFGVLAFLGLSYLVRALLQIPPSNPDSPGVDPSRCARVLMMFLFAALYPLVLPWLGYGAATFLVIGGVTFFLGNRLWWQVFPFALLAPVTIRFVFERMLKISLPRASIEELAAAEDALMKLLSGALLAG